MEIKTRAKFLLRDLLYPGLDLHTRSRALLCRYWRSGRRDVLDAGSGNGYFSWLAYRGGANVLALNSESSQVEKAKAYFLGHHKADPSRLRFEKRNLYDLRDETQTFDEIICYETLEHIVRDAEVLEQFHRILRPGGALHLCCPNRLHPRHQAEELDLAETGGHVRVGYTEEDFSALLEPIGFRIEQSAGLGSRFLYLADKAIRIVRGRLGDFTALPLFPFALLVLKLESLNPATPFCVYVKATKAAQA